MCEIIVVIQLYIQYKEVGNVPLWWGIILTGSLCESVGFCLVCLKCVTEGVRKTYFGKGTRLILQYSESNLGDSIQCTLGVFWNFEMELNVIYLEIFSVSFKLKGIIALDPWSTDMQFDSEFVVVSPTSSVCVSACVSVWMTERGGWCLDVELSWKYKPVSLKRNQRLKTLYFDEQKLCVINVTWGQCWNSKSLIW